MQVAGKVCLVTGGAQGIGWATTRLLVDHGAEVYVGDASEENLAVAAGVADHHPWAGRVHLSRCDVSDRRGVNAWVDEVYERHGRIDALVNNAAFSRWSVAAEMPAEDMQRMMRVGYEGTVFCTQAVLSRMRGAGGGHVVNIGSVAAQVFLVGGSAAYAAAKAAIEAYTRVLQIELWGSNVRVTLVRPGLVMGTDLFRRVVDAGLLPRIADLLPLGRPEQVARAVLRALRDAPAVLTVPWQYRVLGGLYHVFPGLSRWVCRLGGPSRRYERVRWCGSEERVR